MRECARRHGRGANFCVCGSGRPTFRASASMSAYGDHDHPSRASSACSITLDLSSPYATCGPRRTRCRRCACAAGLREAGKGANACAEQRAATAAAGRAPRLERGVDSGLGEVADGAKGLPRLRDRVVACGRAADTVASGPTPFPPALACTQGRRLRAGAAGGLRAPQSSCSPSGTPAFGKMSPGQSARRTRGARKSVWRRFVHPGVGDACARAGAEGARRRRTGGERGPLAPLSGEQVAGGGENTARRTLRAAPSRQARGTAGL